MTYWQCGDWIGVGPGAHGRLSIDGQRIATETPLAPTTWLSQVNASGHGESKRSVLTKADERSERLMMGLRLRDGIPAAGLGLGASADELVRQELLSVSDGRVRATARGRLVLNAILRELLNDPSVAASD